MILADTSVWIDHLRTGEPQLASLLTSNKILGHPLILGELACGHLKNRRRILALLRALPAAPQATNEEALFFIEQHTLMGKGIGFIDAHLLASVSLTGTGRLWTRDKRLAGVAAILGLG